MEVEVQFGDISRLAILQPRELLGVSEDKLDLKPQLVESEQIVGILLDIGGKQLPNTGRVAAGGDVHSRDGKDMDPSD